MSKWTGRKILVDLFCVLIILWKFQRDRSTATPRRTNPAFRHIYAYSSPLQTTPFKNIFHNTVYSDVTDSGIIGLLVTSCVLICLIKTYFLCIKKITQFFSQLHLLFCINKRQVHNRNERKTWYNKRKQKSVYYYYTITTITTVSLTTF